MSNGLLPTFNGIVPVDTGQRADTKGVWITLVFARLMH
jgi:hypothetical protein